MRITFRRFPEHANAYSLIERDGQAAYSMKEFTRPGTGLPHDLRHLITERELGVRDGLWDGIAAGPAPVSPERLARARLLTGLVEAVAALASPSERDIARLIPPGLADVPPPGALARAARALQVEAARWARLRVGESLVYAWPPAQTRRIRRDECRSARAVPARYRG